MPTKSSYPHRALAREYGLPYATVLLYSDRMDPRLRSESSRPQEYATEDVNTKLSRNSVRMLYNDIRELLRGVGA